MFNVDNGLDIPRDVTKKEILCQLIGRKEFVVENYKRLLFFLPDQIKIQCASYILCIKGENLIISYYNNDSIIINGDLNEISFL